jgi:hypothetical protein
MVRVRAADSAREACESQAETTAASTAQAEAEAEAEAEAVDTAILRAMIVPGALSTPGAALHFLDGPHRVSLAQGEAVLLNAGKHTELVALYRSRGAHAKALSLLERLARRPHELRWSCPWPSLSAQSSLVSLTHTRSLADVAPHRTDMERGVHVGIAHSAARLRRTRRPSQRARRWSTCCACTRSWRRRRRSTPSHRQRRRRRRRRH